MPTHGKTDTVAAIPKYIECGQVLGLSVTAGGTGYTNGTQTVTISGGGGAGATATATVVGGVVQSITMTSFGAGYTSDPTATVATGSGLTVLVKRAPINYNASDIVFVDDTEAGVASNKTKGITSPGWWWYRERLDSNGDPRYNAQLLATITSVTADAGAKEEDLIAADVTSVATITVQPTNQTTVTGNATFAVTATITGGGALAYQWELAPAATPTKFAVVGGATSASLAVSGKTVANTGDVYRCVVSGGGTKRVVSSTATLTFGS